MCRSCRSVTRPSDWLPLKSGNIDGSVFNAPFGSEAKKFNLNIVADAVALGIPYFNTGICGSARYLQKNEAKILNFLRAYIESIKIFKAEPEYTLKALAQFTRVNDQELLKEAYEYNKNKIPDIPYPSLTAMQAVVDPLIAGDPKLAKVDAKNFINDRYLKKLEKEGSSRGCRDGRKTSIGIAIDASYFPFAFFTAAISPSLKR